MEKYFFELCKTGKPDHVSGALRAGASLCDRNEHDRTPLMCAAGNNPDRNVIALLLDAGAAVNDANSSGKTALMLASGYNTNPEVVTLLLDRGTDPKARDASGKTVLDFAAENESLKDSPVLDLLRKAFG